MDCNYCNFIYKENLNWFLYKRIILFRKQVTLKWIFGIFSFKFQFKFYHNLNPLSWPTFQHHHFSSHFCCACVDPYAACKGNFCKNELIQHSLAPFGLLAELKCHSLFLSKLNISYAWHSPRRTLNRKKHSWNVHCVHGRTNIVSPEMLAVVPAVNRSPRLWVPPHFCWGFLKILHINLIDFFKNKCFFNHFWMRQPEKRSKKYFVSF